MWIHVNASETSRDAGFLSQRVKTENVRLRKLRGRWNQTAAEKEAGVSVLKIFHE